MQTWKYKVIYTGKYFVQILQCKVTLGSALSSFVVQSIIGRYFVVECAIKSVKCRKSVECEVWGVDCGVESVKWTVWCVKWTVWSVECGAWSVECRV